MTRIRMQRSNVSSSLKFDKCEVAFTGSPVDDRGDAVMEFVKESAEKIFTVSWDPRKLVLSVGDEFFNSGEIEDFLERINPDLGPLLLEATTLGFVEIFLLLKAAKEINIPSVIVLYTEPKEYSSSRPDLPDYSPILHPRYFDLTDEVEEFSGVPGAALLLETDSTERVVFLLGYEGDRFARALEQVNINPSECVMVFGVPAYHVGWEMNSFANNVPVIKTFSDREITYAGAQNPARVYAVLNEISKSCHAGQRMLISPIGTKPHGVGAAVFACDSSNVGLLYDHPSRKKKRSIDVAIWHLYTVDFS